MMNDERLKKSIDPARQSRQAVDRPAIENRELSDDDRVEMFRQQFHQDALPDLPRIPGFHTCWLTTANPRDSIQQRLRLGYQLLTTADIPGWDYVTIKTGEWSGFIGVNEMLAAKLPMSLYQRFMEQAHHIAPMGEDEKLTAMTDNLHEEAERAGAKLIEGDGIKALRESPRAGIFADT
jgi:hypothetical protein